MKNLYTKLTLIILALSTGLLGFTMILMGEHKHIELITSIYSVNLLLPDTSFNLLASVGFLLITLLSLLSINQEKFSKILGYLLIVFSLIPLLSLFSSAMWISSLGGFPAIGAGQGIIKYAALLSIGILLVNVNLPTHIKKWISLAPVMLVLVWIGGMKFTLLEAKGIEALVASSPFMSWMYSIWDLQTTSNIIGVYDLVAVLLLSASIYYQRLVLPAIIMSGAVFLVTQTFLFTWAGALSPISTLSTGGHFLIKDLWFIINLIMFWQISQQPKASS